MIEIKEGIQKNTQQKSILLLKRKRLFQSNQENVDRSLFTIDTLLDSIDTAFTNKMVLIFILFLVSCNHHNEF